MINDPKLERLLDVERDGAKGYSVFGLTVASDFPFVNRLLQRSGRPDLEFTCTSGEPPVRGWQERAPIFKSPWATDEGKSFLYLYRQPSFEVLRFTDIADFYLWRRRIVCHLLDPACEYLVEICFLGIVLSYWLERQGIPTLHASAVAMDHGAAAFLAHNKGGKSGVAATLMQLGYPMLTDDVLVVREQDEEFVGCAGYPQMRMWPDQAEYFLGHHEDLEKVHPAYSKRRVSVGPGGLGSFRHAAQSLSCFYVLERQTDRGQRAIEVTPLSPGEAIIEFVRHSFLPRITEAAGLQPRRFDFFARMARRIPVRKVLYPSGFERLSRLSEAILEDQERSRGSLALSDGADRQALGERR